MNTSPCEFGVKTVRIAATRGLRLAAALPGPSAARVRSSLRRMARPPGQDISFSARWTIRASRAGVIVPKVVLRLGARLFAWLSRWNAPIRNWRLTRPRIRVLDAQEADVLKAGAANAGMCAPEVAACEVRQVVEFGRAAKKLTAPQTTIGKPL